MFQQKLTFKNSRNLKLSAIFEGDDKQSPLVILCHGFRSSKDSSITQVELSRKLTTRGLSVFRFDFTGHGKSEGSWRDITPKQGLDDLESAVKTLDKKEFAIFGSSFGGYVSLLYASEAPILALALKAPVSDFSLLAKDEMPTPQRQKFIGDTKEIDLYEKAKNIKCPVLIVHGDADDTVPIVQSRKLLKYLPGEKRLEVLAGAAHKIRGKALEKTLILTTDFFKEKLT